MSEPQKTKNSDDSRSQSLKNQPFLEKLQIAVAIMVPIFGIYTSWQSNKAADSAAASSKAIQQIQIELQQREQETKRVQEFTKRIQDQLTNLAGENPTKAKIALASLYSLAEKESDKSILFTIAIVSENEAMKNTIKDLILEDPSATGQFKDQIRVKLGKRLTASSTATKTSESASQAITKTSVEKKLLQQLTQEQAKISGWIYLGKTKAGNEILENDKTIKSNQIPSKNTTIETATSVNLRDRAPSGRGLGAIKGILAENSKLKVEDIKKVGINTNYDAIWAQVSENSTN